VNAAIEATAIIHSATKALMPTEVLPTLEAHAILGAPGALFIEAKDALDVVAVSHKALDAMLSQNESMVIMRLLPVENICDALPDAVTAAVKPLLSKHGLGEGDPALSFAVRFTPLCALSISIIIISAHLNAQFLFYRFAARSTARS